MTFTDEDLKRLKEDIKHRLGTTWFPLYDMEALLVRLKAAEAVADWAIGYGQGNFDEVAKTWRKAAGK